MKVFHKDKLNLFQTLFILELREIWLDEFTIKRINLYYKNDINSLANCYRLYTKFRALVFSLWKQARTQRSIYVMPMDKMRPDSNLSGPQNSEILAARSHTQSQSPISNNYMWKFHWNKCSNRNMEVYLPALFGYYDRTTDATVIGNNTLPTIRA